MIVMSLRNYYFREFKGDLVLRGANVIMEHELMLYLKRQRKSEIYACFHISYVLRKKPPLK